MGRTVFYIETPVAGYSLDIIKTTFAFQQQLLSQDEHRRLARSDELAHFLGWKDFLQYGFFSHPQGHQAVLGLLRYERFQSRRCDQLYYRHELSGRIIL